MYRARFTDAELEVLLRQKNRSGEPVFGEDFLRWLRGNGSFDAILDLPPKGTHAHSMVEAFMALGEGEIGAFRAYADVYPEDCLLLVDTIDTLESGVPNAIRVFEELKRKGHSRVGIRLDAGDLAHLSVQAAKVLNDAGFPDAKVVLSNQLDEVVIWQIKTQIREEAPGSGAGRHR
jgi:nicotinate phosphoribosyltransferase